MGGASPNHCLGIGEKSKEDLVKLLNLCVNGKKVVVAAEVKFSVISIQKTPPVIFPYFGFAVMP